MRDGQNNGKGTSFWQTLPGTIVKITGLITAITGLIVTLDKTGVFRGEPEGQAPPQYIGEPEGQAPPQYTIETRVFDTLPFCTKNFIVFQDFLYWLHVEVANESNRPLHLEISFHVRTGPATASRVPAGYDVYPGERLSENVDPAFEFLQDDIDVPLGFKWVIQDVDNNILDQDTESILVLAKNIIDWDLMTPEGYPVPRDFLLACLAAWVQTRETVVLDYAHRLCPDSGPISTPALYLKDFLDSCYQEFFTKSPGLRVETISAKLSMRGRQRIRTASQVLNEGKADPLEASLLLGAITRSAWERHGARLAMLVLPAEAAEPVHESVLLAWSGESDDWSAIDLAHAGAHDFEQNLNLATSKVRELLEARPEIVSRLDSSGVFIEDDEGFVALDFANAADYFDILGLP